MDLFARIADFSRLKKSVGRIPVTAILLDLFNRRSGAVRADGNSRTARLSSTLAVLDPGGRDDIDVVMEN